MLLNWVAAGPVFAQNLTGILRGRVTDAAGHAIFDANILLSPGGLGAVTDAQGRFEVSGIPQGAYTLRVSHLSYALFREKIRVGEGAPAEIAIVLADAAEVLQDVSVYGHRAVRAVTFPASIAGTTIFAGKKSQVVHLQGADANLAENNPRQIFARVPGVSVWEMDGTGNQVGVATRGLNPHRSWELNVRQNGDVINSDLFGYPEAHYNPPMEAVDKIELVRGSGALQYGPQFGGMLNYVLKKPDTTRRITFETRQSAGSFGLFSSFNALGGKVGKLTYYGYYNFRRSEGWRANSDYHFNAWHAGLAYQLGPKASLAAELSHMQYVNHFAAGLTDAMFREDPRQSNRPRNYFNPTIYVPALRLQAQLGPKTLLTARVSAILGQRNSVQFIHLPTVNDTINPATNQYDPRQVDRDYYHSYSVEARLRHDYKLLGHQSHLVAGVRYGHSKTDRRQKGLGTTASDFDLSLTSEYTIDLAFRTVNYAAFAENVFTLTDRLSLTPGIRFDYIDTDLTGAITAYATPEVPFGLTRRFPVFGVGAEYELAPGVQAYANLTQAYRPVLHSDILPASPLDRTDPNLEDARGNNGELGIRGHWQDVLTWDVNYFSLRYNNRIGTLIQTDGTDTFFYKTNIGDTRNRGAEVYLEFHPFNLSGAGSGHSDLGLFTSTAYNHATYTKGTVSAGGQNVDLTGNTVENVPTLISRSGITYRYRTWSSSVQFSYVSESYSDALNTVASESGVNGIVPSYFLMDFNMTFRFGGHYNVQLSLSNLLDNMYFTRRATGYPGPGILPSDGRSFLLSFGARI